MNNITLSLMHHGIDGMHWGERNGPPYPLVTNTHNLRSGEERKKIRSTKFTKKQDTKIKKSDNFFDKLKSKKPNPYKNSKSEVKNKDDRKKFDKGTAKKVAIAVGAVAATAAITAGIAFVASGKSGIMLRNFNEARHLPETIEGKRYMDRVIKKGELVQTLSFDPDRIKDPTGKYGGYIYGAVTDNDKNQYMALLNRMSLNKDVFKEKSKSIPEKLKAFTGAKYSFNLKAAKDIKVASEATGVDALEQMMKADKGLRKYVTDTIINGKTESGGEFIPASKLKNLVGYKEAAEAAEKAAKRLEQGKGLTTKEANAVYRLFNYALPIDDPQAKMYKDKFFNYMKRSGYGAILDTNDAMYGQYKAEMPVIVFDMDSMITDSVRRTTLKDIMKAQGKFAKNIGEQVKKAKRAGET